MTLERVMVFGAVARMFQSPTAAERVANALDREYAERAGKPEWHQPFTAKDNPEKVAISLAGLYATNGAGEMAAVVPDLDNRTRVVVDAEKYITVLKKMRDSKLTPEEETPAMLFANVAWRSGQPFRDITSKPLNRLARPVNAPWGTLPWEERVKDLVQVRKAAELLLQDIRAELVEIAAKAEAARNVYADIAVDVAWRLVGLVDN